MTPPVTIAPNGTLIHVSITKEYLLTLLRTEGASRVLVGWPGSSEEAIAKLQADARSHFVLDPSCDHVAPTGECLGHQV